MTEYTTSMVGNYYTDNTGIYLDSAKRGHKDRMHKYDSQTLMDASTWDDGITYGINTRCDGNDETDSILVQVDQIPYVVDKLDENYVVLVSKTKGGTTTAASEMWNSIGFKNYVRFRWNTNIVVNSANLAGLGCKIRDAGSWEVKWTGIPKVDEWICSSGKQIYDISVDMFLTCKDVQRFDPVFEWQLNFNVPWKSVWNFIVSSVQTVMATPYFNFSLYPAITLVDTNRYPVIDNIPEQDQYQEDNTHATKDLAYTGMYPPLPTAPLEDIVSGTAVSRKAKKTAMTRLKRFFKPLKKT